MIGPEARKILTIGAGVSLTIAASVGIALIETLIVSSLGAAELAGVTLALSLYNIVFVACLGVVVAITPILSRAVGRQDDSAIRSTAHQAIWVAGAMSAAGLLVLALSSLFLRHLTNTPAELVSSLEYLWGAAPGLPAWILYVALRSILIATNKVRIATFVMLASVPVHAGLAYILTYGTAVSAPLGVLGAGIAYSAISYLTVGAVLVGMVRSRSPLLANVMAGPFRLRWHEFRAIVALGLPMAGRIVLREGTMPASVLLVAPLGAEALAAHAVALRIVSLAGIASFGISNATIARVGMALGSGDWSRARQVGGIAGRLSLIIGLILCLGIVATAEPVARLFLANGDSGLIALAARLLGVCCLFILLDCLQGPAVGALVALQDAKWPLAIFAGGTWLIGFPLAYGLSRALSYPLEAAWAGLIIGSGVSTGLLVLRLRWKLRNGSISVAA